MQESHARRARLGTSAYSEFHTQKIIMALTLRSYKC